MALLKPINVLARLWSCHCKNVKWVLFSLPRFCELSRDKISIVFCLHPMTHTSKSMSLLLHSYGCYFTIVFVYAGRWQLQKGRLLERSCWDRDPPVVHLSLFPRLSLNSVKYSIIYILTLPERHRPIKRPSGGVACGLYFYESSRRVFTGSALLHVPDSPHSYSAAYKRKW